MHPKQLKREEEDNPSKSLFVSNVVGSHSKYKRRNYFYNT